MASGACQQSFIHAPVPVMLAADPLALLAPYYVLVGSTHACIPLDELDPLNEQSIVTLFTHAASPCSHGEEWLASRPAVPASAWSVGLTLSRACHHAGFYQGARAGFEYGLLKGALQTLVVFHTGSQEEKKQVWVHAPWLLL